MDLLPRPFTPETLTERWDRSVDQIRARALTTECRRQASGKLGTAISGARRVIAEMAAGTTALNGLPTPTLLGILCGGAMMLAAYIATSFFPQLSFGVMGPLAPVVGIPSGLLFARYRNRNSSEANAEARRVLIAYNRQGVEQLREDLKQPGIPAADRAKMLGYIATLNEDLFQMSRIPREMQPIPDYHANRQRRIAQPGGTRGSRPTDTHFSLSRPTSQMEAPALVE